MSIDHAYATTIEELRAAQAAGIPVESFSKGLNVWLPGKHWSFVRAASDYRIAPSHAARGCGQPIEQPGALKYDNGKPDVALKYDNGKPDVALKYDNGKPDVALLPPEALLAIAEVFTFGAKKYAPDNWRGGFAYRRVVSAILRHLFAWLAGQDKDPETGLSHIAHVGCNVMFLLTFIITKTGTDDRYKAPNAD